MLCSRNLTQSSRMSETLLRRMLVALISFFWIMKCEGAVSVRARHYAPEGEKTSINCSVTDEEFTGWFDSSGRKITSDSSQRIHVREDGSLKYLEISTVNRTDRGTYECRGKTNKDQVMLLVEYRPVLIRDRSSQKTTFSSLDSGEEVTLSCEFEGFPTPEIKFKKDNNELNASDVTNQPGFVSYKFRVRSQGDFGFYSCVATNSRGSETYYMELYERGPPEPPNNVQAFPICDRIDVTWEASRKDGGSAVTGYMIRLQRGGDTVQSESLSASERTTSLGSLEKGTEYAVRISSINTLGEGEWRMVFVNTTVTCKGKYTSSASNLSLVPFMIMSVHSVL